MDAITLIDDVNETSTVLEDDYDGNDDLNLQISVEDSYDYIDDLDDNFFFTE